MGHNRCLLGCSEGEDSIEHYCRCFRSRKFASEVLRIEVEPEYALNVWMLNFKDPLELHELWAIATWVYVIYTVTNTFRATNTWPQENRAWDAMKQASKRAVEGNNRMTKWLDQNYTVTKVPLKGAMGYGQGGGIRRQRKGDQQCSRRVRRRISAPNPVNASAIFPNREVAANGSNRRRGMISLEILPADRNMPLARRC